MTLTNQLDNLQAELAELAEIEELFFSDIRAFSAREFRPVASRLREIRAEIRELQTQQRNESLASQSQSQSQSQPRDMAEVWQRVLELTDTPETAARLAEVEAQLESDLAAIDADELMGWETVDVDVVDVDVEALPAADADESADWLVDEYMAIADPEFEDEVVEPTFSLEEEFYAMVARVNPVFASFMCYVAWLISSLYDGVRRSISSILVPGLTREQLDGAIARTEVEIGLMDNWLEAAI